MDVVSTYKFARISARKARDVAREIQGLPVSAALDILNFTPRKGAELFAKTMKTALADAENNFELDIDTLVVKEATVGEGPTFRRFKPRARGSAAPIRKRTSHIRVVLTDDIGGEEEVEEVRPKSKKSGSDRKARPEPENEVLEETPSEEESAQDVDVVAESGDIVGEKASRTKKSEEKGEIPEGARIDGKKGLVYDSAPSEVDDLTEIHGIGPKLQDKLQSEGIYRFDQIASWDGDQVAAFEELLSFKEGRIEKDEWIETARKLVGK